MTWTVIFILDLRTVRGHLTVPLNCEGTQYRRSFYDSFSISPIRVNGFKQSG